MINNSFDLLVALKRQGFPREQRAGWWWPNSGSFEVVVGAILTQQTRWEKVEQSLLNIRRANRMSIEGLSQITQYDLVELVRPSGFYNIKAQRLIALANNIKKEFGDFSGFSKGVSREWLLSQTGIGEESADSILCYACYRPVMVADAYSERLLRGLGYDFAEYAQLQQWLSQGVIDNIDRAISLYESEISLAQIYARFHGKIVSYCKENSKGREVEVFLLESG